MKKYYIFLLLLFIDKTFCFASTEILKPSMDINKLTKQNIITGKLKSKKVIIEQKKNSERAHKVAKELQDVLVFKMLESIYAGVKPNKIFGGGHGETAFRSMLNEERAKLIDLDLVDDIKKQIIKNRPRKK